VVANKLDYLSFTPFSSTVNNKYKTDLPENRRAAYTYLEYQAIAFPFYDKRFADPKVRQAISMAIDRVGLIQKVYNGLRKPADGLVAPNVQGHLDNQCGDLCSYPARQSQAAVRLDRIPGANPADFQHRLRHAARIPRVGQHQHSSAVMQCAQQFRLDFLS
jgi:ABC-type transport system substrate-binding protein